MKKNYHFYYRRYLLFKKTLLFTGTFEMRVSDFHFYPSQKDEVKIEAGS
jgi:hypothetical protein